MEKKGRILDSGNQLRKKKMGIALPLGAFLSFNDRDVHPHCPDSSNPYHKCGRHCLLKIPSAKNFFRAVTSDGWDLEGGEMPEGRGVNPNCPNASNPFHKCAEYCLERLSEKRGGAGKEPAVKPKEENKAVVIAGRVNSECKNASNPYHVCAAYCFQNVLQSDQPRKVMKLKSRMLLKKIVSNIEITSVRSQCKYPSHECNEICFKNVPDGNGYKGEKKPKGVSFKSDTSSTHSRHKHLSRSYNEDAQIFFEDTSEKEHSAAMKPKPDNRTVFTGRGEYSACQNASNIQHVCSEYCFQALPEKVQRGDVIVKAKEIRNVADTKERTMNPVCRNASNPYHVCAEYCFQLPESHQPGRAIMKSNEDKGVTVPLERGINQVCKNAANPYHVCAKNCFKNVPEKHKPVRAMMKSREEEVIAESWRVNLDCKNASNRYHVCAEYCLQNAPERERQRKVKNLRSQKQLNKTVSNIEMRSVHPQCRYASNPYHECAEYCFQMNVPGRHNPEAVMKPTERKKENSHALRKDAVPKFNNASNNPPHRCSEYCSEEIGEKNQPVEDIPVMIKGKKRNSSKKERRNHQMMLNGSMDLEYVQASKSNNNDVESSGEKIILQDGMEKSSIESRYVQDELNTNSNDTELCEGITMRDGTKCLHSVVEVVETRNRKESAGVQPLPIDASDLLQEWSKYSYQERFAEDIIVMQDNKVERRKISTTKDKGNVVLNSDTSNLLKAQVKGGSQRFLPTSVLLFVGFLFSIFYWTQVIHSLVVSSEKNRGLKRLTNKGHDMGAKCSNVSDPYHLCSECCFRGMSEEMH